MSISIYPISGDALSSDGALQLVYDSNALLDAARLTGDQTPNLLYQSSETPLFFFGPSTPLVLVENCEYILDFNAVCRKISADFEGVLEVYLVGDAFPSTNPLGELVGRITSPVGVVYHPFKNNTYNVISKLSGTAHLRFVVYGGQWNISSVTFSAAAEFGFTPVQSTLLVPVIGYRKELIKFKVDLYDANNNLLPLKLESDPIFFDGGNLVVKGSDNKVDGTITVGADSGSKNIVITTSGYKNASGVTVPSASAIYIGEGQFKNPTTPFIVGQDPSGTPIFGLGDRMYAEDVNGTFVVTVSGTMAVEPDGDGTGFEDVRDYIVYMHSSSIDISNAYTRELLLQSGTTSDASSSESASILQAQITAVSTSNAQISASLVNEIQDRINADISYSASQAEYTTVVSSSLIAVSASGVQTSASLVNEVQNRINADLNYSASQASYTSVVSASLVSVSASNIQVSESLVNEVQDRINADLSYSSSQAAYTTQVSASFVDKLVTNTQVSQSLVDEIQNRINADLQYSASQTAYTTLVSQSLADVSSSVAQTSATGSILDTANKVKLPQSLNKVDPGLYIESSSIGFWRPHAEGSGNSDANFPVVINADGQVRIANKDSWTGTVVDGKYTEQIAFANGVFVVQTKNLFLDTPGLQIVGTDTGSSNSSFIKLGESSSKVTVSSGSGFYADGAGNFRVGSDATGSDYIQLTPGNALLISSSNFFLNSKSGGNSLKLTPFEFAMGNPAPTSYTPLSSVGFYANRSGQFFVGSGSVGSTAGQGTGSWISFGGTDLNIRTEKLFLNTLGMMIQGTNSVSASSNVIKMGASAADITLTTNDGIYFDGAGNFRVGTGTTGTDYLMFVPGNALLISSSNFFLNSSNGGNTLKLTTNEFALGNPVPSAYNPIGKIGLYANRSGQFFIGSGSVGANAGQGTGSWISFGGTDLNIRTEKLFLNTLGMVIQGTDSTAAAANVIKMGSNVSAITLARGAGFYADGAGNFRVGTDTSGSDYLQLTPGNALIVSSSNFLLNSVNSGNTLKVSPVDITLGNPAPSSFNPINKVGFYANRSGQFFLGSGSVGTTAGDGSGSWISFGGTDLNIRTEKFFLNTLGMVIQGTNSTTGSANVIKLGANAKSITLTNGSGFYADGDGNFRVGSSTAGTDYIQLTPGNALIVSSSNFLLNSTNTGNTLKITPFDISLGNPNPIVYNPVNSVGFYVNRGGQFFIGSGSVGATAGQGTGSWISFGGTDLNIRTEKLFLNTLGMVIQGTNSSTAAANVIKVGANASAITLLRGAGLYADGAGNFRVGSDVSGSDYIQLTPGNALFVSASNFFLNATSGNNSILLSPFEIGLGAPRPTSFDGGAGSVGFYANRSGQIFIGSGSADPVNPQNSVGNFLSFGTQIMHIRSEIFRFFGGGITLDSANGGSLALGSATSYSTGNGVFANGNGSFRVGNPTGNRLEWDGTSLNVFGNITIMGGNAATTSSLNTAVTSSKNQAIAAASADVTNRGLGTDGNYTGNVNGVSSTTVTQATTLSNTYLGKNYKEVGTITTEGWYRIAYNQGDRAFATFTIAESESGRHNTAQFTLGCSYNTPSVASFALLNNTRFSTQTFTKVRLLTKTTYDQMYVDVYVANPLGTIDNYVAEITDNIQINGWVGVDWTAATVPTGYTSTEYIISKDNVADATGRNTSADTANVNGTAAATVVNNAAAGAAAKAVTDANFNGTGLKTAIQGVNLPTMTPGSSGLFMTKDYIGFYNSGWSSYISSNGQFQFKGNTSNLIAWNGSTLIISGSIYVAGGNAATDADVATVDTKATNAQSTANTANSTANTATTNISNLGNGTYSGTFISGKKIISPEISGSAASITGILNVGGSGGITLNGTSSSTPKIYIGSGAFFNANTPFYVARSSTGGTELSLGSTLKYTGETNGNASLWLSPQTTINGLPIPRNVKTGQCTDGQTITFTDPPFTDPPQIFFGACELTYHPNMSSSPHGLVTSYTSTPTSFTPSIKLQASSGTTTSYSSTWTDSVNTTSTSIGANPAASNNTYSVSYDLTVNSNQQVRVDFLINGAVAAYRTYDGAVMNGPISDGMTGSIVGATSATTFVLRLTNFSGGSVKLIDVSFSANPMTWSVASGATSMSISPYKIYWIAIGTA